jgi:hypothetical protein
MKKLTSAIALATVALAMQAGSGKPFANKGSSCCGTDIQSSKHAKAQAATAKQDKTAHSAAKTLSNRSNAKPPLQSPKGFADSR